MISIIQVAGLAVESDLFDMWVHAVKLIIGDAPKSVTGEGIVVLDFRAPLMTEYKDSLWNKISV